MNFNASTLLQLSGIDPAILSPVRHLDFSDRLEYEGERIFLCSTSGDIFYYRKYHVKNRGKMLIMEKNFNFSDFSTGFIKVRV